MRIIVITRVSLAMIMPVARNTLYSNGKNTAMAHRFQYDQLHFVTNKNEIWNIAV